MLICTPKRIVSSYVGRLCEKEISRNAYFRGSFLDQGFGFSGDFSFLPPPPTHGWPHYDAIPDAGANVGWTWPYNTF